MKKLVIAAALIMGMGTTAFANKADTTLVETVVTVQELTPVEVKDLPKAIQDAIAKDYAESTIKEASVEASEDGSKTYKVVLTDKEGTESTLLFNESGEVLK